MTVSRHPGIRIHPPVLFGVALAASWLLERLLPLPIGEPDSPLRWGVSTGMSLVGTAIAIWALAHFRRAGTGIPVHHAVTALVTTGPYRWSRNPMYGALVLIHAGIGLWLNTAWAFVLLPIVLAVLHQFVIMREEALLARLFGDAYRVYARRVRRWF